MDQQERLATESRYSDSVSLLVWSLLVWPVDRSLLVWFGLDSLLVWSGLVYSLWSYWSDLAASGTRRKSPDRIAYGADALFWRSGTRSTCVIYTTISFVAFCSTMHTVSSPMMDTFFSNLVQGQSASQPKVTLSRTNPDYKKELELDEFIFHGDKYHSVWLTNKQTCPRTVHEISATPPFHCGL